MAIVELTDTIVEHRPINWPEAGEMHFRLADTVLGALDLTCDTGYVVRSYEFGFPAVREVTALASLDDGTFDGTRFVGSRAVTLDLVMRNSLDKEGKVPIIVVGPNGEELKVSNAMLRDQLLKFCSPSSRPTLFFSEHGDVRVRSLVLRGSDAPQAVSRPQFNELTASWVAPLGFIQETSEHVASFSFGETDLDAEYAITTFNRGTVPAWWRLTISGDLESPMISLGGQELWLNYHIEPPGDTVIDSRTRTVTVGGRRVGYRYLNDKSEWFRIPPGQQRILVRHLSIPRTGYPYGYWQDTSVAGPEGPTGSLETQWTTIVERDVSSTRKPDDSGEFTKFNGLDVLKLDAASGDGLYTGTRNTPVNDVSFLNGDYVKLGDNTWAWYDAGVWVAGSKPLGGNDGEPPPWIWSPKIDPDSGVPVRSEVTLTYREQFL